MNISRDRLNRLLRKLGHEAFRPGQERIIRALLDGRDVLAVLPTGAGKSLVFQLIAQLLPGTTLVVSPLIALMQDQIDAAGEMGIDAGLINSTLTAAEADAAMAQVQTETGRLLYVTPERFGDAEFMREMGAVDVALFVVDEAHCISEWGHDFRPAYLRLGEAAVALGRPPILALTATASPLIRREIAGRLGLREPDIVVRGIDRPNLFLEVIRVEGEDNDRRALRDLLAGNGRAYAGDLATALTATMSGPGIIYTRTVKAAEETAEWLRAWGMAADYYHGQRKPGDRERVQDAFMRGELRVITATNAFGLGVDKPDIRFVVHRDIPASVEEYYQEAGRAGRDGELARCTLIYRPGDLGRAAFLAATGTVDAADLQAIRDATGPDRIALDDLAARTGLPAGTLRRAVDLLVEQGHVNQRNGTVWRSGGDFDPEAVSLEREERRKAYERSRTEMMRGYAEGDGCRRAYILGYFGEEPADERCGRCDNDLMPQAEQAVPVHADADLARPVPFSVGARLVHPAWGEGTLQRIEPDALTVLFDAEGYKTLALDAVLDQELLRPVASAADDA